MEPDIPIGNKTGGTMERHSFGPWVLGAACLLMAILLWGCGYTKEEKDRMKAIEIQGRENAENYIRGKYGFEPETEGIRLCMECDDGDLVPWANGYVLADMSYEGKTFQVHISGEEPGAQGKDDYQYEMIVKEAGEYFEALLGYGLYDIYLEYTEPLKPDMSFPLCHKKNLIGEFYESGSFEELLCRCPSNIRIDDCMDQDLRGLEEENPDAASLLKKWAVDWGAKIVLISYKSREDYLKGYDHTYGRGGILDFDICNDGWYIRSYAAFEKDRMRAKAFEQQECYGMIFSCIDKEEGLDLAVNVGEREWMDLGETDRKPGSWVYSVESGHPGEITVYIPVQQSGKKGRVFIQHLQDGRWWQYEANCKRTADKQYIFFTYYGIHEGGFDFMVD
ncbi:MAG: hypothetical protein HFG70_06145 [Hungatella sp.]|nr:hypothetical protein [Hungatella sp.]